MNIKNFNGLNSKPKCYRAKLKKTQILALGMSIVALISVTGLICTTDWGKKTCANIKKKAINTAEAIKDTIKNDKEDAIEFADDIKEDVNDIIEDIGDKTNAVKKDINVGFNDVKKDINKTVENVSGEFKKPSGNVFRKTSNSKKKVN